MQRVSIVQLEEIGVLLLKLPDLFHIYERGGGALPKKALEWLNEMESVLKQANFLSVAGVAALRGELLSGESGIMPESICPLGSAPKRKHRNALAARVLKEAEVLIQQAITDDGSRMSETVRIGYQVVIIAQKKCMLDKSDMPITEHVWLRLEQDADIVSLLVHMQATVGKRDAKLLLTRSLAVSLTEG